MKEKICRSMYASFLDLVTVTMENQEKSITKGETIVLMITLQFARNMKCLKTQKRDVKIENVTKCM